MTLIVGLVVTWRAYLEPYRRQRETMEFIQRLGGTYEAGEATAWQRRLFGADFQNLTLANVADLDEPAAYLPRIERLPCLEILAVGGQAFGDEHLLRLQPLTTLRQLLLDSTEVSEPAVAELRRHLPQLAVYRSQRRAIADVKSWGSSVEAAHDEHPPPEMIGHFPGAYFDQATAVRMKYPAVSEESLREIRHLTNVKTLWLDGAPLTDEGLAHLAGMSRLEDLSLNYSQVTNEGLRQLEGRAGLRVLWLWRAHVTRDAVDRLRKALPDCHITGP
jgi:hypothetical protein